VGAQVPHAAEPSRRNVAAVSHGEHVPTRTAAAALRVKAALSKAAYRRDFPVSQLIAPVLNTEQQRKTRNTIKTKRNKLAVLKNRQDKIN